MTKAMSTDTPKPDIKDVYNGLQVEMRAKLLGVAAHLPHSVVKGDQTEASWLEMLQSYLPKRYQAERAMVVDHLGQFSEQIDIVIFDRQYSPFVLPYKSAFLVPAEAVYAVFEVKQDLSKGRIGYAGQKVASVRRLARTNAPIVDKGSAREAREPFRILGGLLCSRTDWMPAFGEPFKDALKGLVAEQKLELGCCLEAGVFEDGGHLEPLKSSESSELMQKYPWLKQPYPLSVLGGASNSLVIFLFTLLQRLQSLGTVSAIEFDKYRAGLIPQK